ncbi:TonB-dependent receptor plug domain-containing protein [Aureimonas mangrovi]|uniref:TonB-dependent receptor plug domain-containing protein n=1 Tax=Aureimonas mangrovi TaxID=2758041 RepID=UPI00163DC4D0|nr:TonB-dependent receptor [Aureimonas mangrovi]
MPKLSLRRSASRPALLALSLSASAALPSLASAQEAAPFSLQLDEVVVSANLVPTPLTKVGSAVTAVEGEELEHRQTRLVSDVLREIPGVAVNRAGPVGQFTQVRIRGSESNQTLVLIDGIRVNDPSADSEFDFAHLLAQEVERVEVLRGPQSALYGSDAIGGVINIVTRRGSGAPTVRIRAEGGSFGTAMGQASVSAGDETYDFIASGAGYRTDGISIASEARGNSERDGYENATGFAKLNLRPSEIFELSLVGRYVDYKADGDDFFGGIGAVDADIETDGKQFFGRAEGKLSLLDGRWDHIFGLGYTRNERDTTTETTPYGFTGETRRVDYQTNFSFDTPALFDTTHISTFAIQHEENSAVSENAFSSFDRTIDTTGFVGQHQVTFADRLSLTGSLRHDDNDIFEDADTYRLTGAYSFLETGTKLRASFGTGVKNPTLYELYGYSEDYRGNPDLQPEEARGWDVGIDQTLWDGLAFIEATYFDQRIENLITGSGQTSINLPGESKIDGVELGLTLQLLDGLTARAAYTRTNGEDADGDELVRRPRDIASLNLDYRFGEEERAGVNLGIIYNGSQKDLFFDEFFASQVVELDSYVLVNVAGSYRLTDNAEIYGRVENLFDEGYEEVFTYGTPGRAAYAGLNLTF